MPQHVRHASIWLVLGAVSACGCTSDAADSDSVTSEECAEGEERCACYPNGTCNDGLDCLSNFCVDTSVDAGEGRGSTQHSDDADRAGDANDEDAGADDTDHPETDPPETDRPDADDDETDDDTVDGETSGDDPSDFADTTADEADGTPNNDTDSPGRDEADAGETDDSAATNDGDATDDPSGDQTTSDDSTDDAWTDTNLDDTTAATTDDQSAQVDEGAPDDTANDDAASDDSGSDPEPLGIPALPPRAADALDAPATSIVPQRSCALGIDIEAMCVGQVDCADPDACLASLEWIWAEAPASSPTQTLVLRDLSGDGAVVFGDYVSTEGSESRHAFVWRWGSESMTLLSDTAGSSGSAINYDATAATGANRTCTDCSYTGVRWTSAGGEPIPEQLGIPSDISYDTKVIGSTRRDDGVLWGFVWDGGEPTLAQTLALQKISGDGEFVGAVADGGPVVLFYADGTLAIPSTGNYRPDGVLGVSDGGAVVIGFGWHLTDLNSPMFRWNVGQSVDVIQPAAGFSDVVPFGIDATGSVMVGVNRQAPAPPPIPQDDIQAFYWDEADGMRPLHDELATRGIEVPAGMVLHDPYISAEGSTLVGRGYNDGSPILWRVRLAR